MSFIIGAGLLIAAVASALLAYWFSAIALNPHEPRRNRLQAALFGFGAGFGAGVSGTSAILLPALGPIPPLF